MRKQHDYYVYIMTNQYDKVLYIGVTNNIVRRTYEHKIKYNPKSFTARYQVNKLVYFEPTFPTPLSEILHLCANYQF